MLNAVVVTKGNRLVKEKMEERMRSRIKVSLLLSTRWKRNRYKK